MVNDFRLRSAFLNIEEEWILKFSPTMVDNFRLKNVNFKRSYLMNDQKEEKEKSEWVGIADGLNIYSSISCCLNSCYKPGGLQGSDSLKYQCT